ncbi:MAG: hypothetical protein OQK82_01330 [Candidatus Pacearchaeota archaeon]|nr:hypothetical protein [Candidatus Pacearchaeota archaeon]
MFDNTRKFSNLYGEEVTVTYQPLVHKEAMDVEINALGLVMGVVAGAFEHVRKLFEEIDYVPEDVPEQEKDETDGSPKTAQEKLVPLSSTVHVARAMDALYKAIPSDKLWWLGEKILRGCIIQGPAGNAKIDSLSKSNYFTDRLDEFALSIFWGLDVSFPRAFTKARELLSAFGVKRPGQTSQETSNTSSPERPQNSLR